MSTSDSRRPAQPAGTEVSVSSPPPRHSAPPSSRANTVTTGTGFPPNMEGPYPTFTQVEDKDFPRGNRQYDFMMRRMGHYGHFLPFDRKASVVTPILMNADHISTSITTVLRTALERALVLKGHTNPTEIGVLSAGTAANLTIGCMMMFYCRLRAVNKSFIETSSRFLIKPHIPDSFEIPTPYAIAFQNLGLFRVENLPDELELIPTLSDAHAATLCIGNARWSPSQYQTSMEFAKSVGITFRKLDLTVKLGSAWWLFKPITSDAEFYLTCCLPESNYTKEDAVIRALWCASQDGTFHVDIADLSSLTMDRGTFLRNAPPDIALTSFYGMMEAPEPVWGIN